MRCEGLQSASNTIIKTDAQGNDQIGIVHAHVGGVGAVHPGHGNVVRMIARQSAQPHQRADSWRIHKLHQLTKFGTGSRMNHAAASINHGPFGFQHHLRGTTNLAGVPFGINLVARQVDRCYRVILHVPLKHIFRDVYQHWTRTTRGSNVERFMNGLRQIRNILDQEVVLGGRAGDAESIGFLKCVGTDQRAGDLAGKGDNRNGIEQCIHQTSGQIRGAGTRRRTADTSLAGGPYVALCGESGILFVTYKYVPNRMIIHGVIKRDGDTTRVSINGVDAFAHQTFEQDFRSTHQVRHNVIDLLR